MQIIHIIKIFPRQLEISQILPNIYNGPFYKLAYPV